MTLAMATAFWKEAVRMKLLPLMQALFRLRITQERANKDFLSKHLVSKEAPLLSGFFLYTVYSNHWSPDDYM